MYVHVRYVICIYIYTHYGGKAERLLALQSCTFSILVVVVFGTSVQYMCDGLKITDILMQKIRCRSHATTKSMAKFDVAPHVASQCFHEKMKKIKNVTFIYKAMFGPSGGSLTCQ